MNETSYNGRENSCGCTCRQNNTLQNRSACPTSCEGSVWQRRSCQRSCEGSVWQRRCPCQANQNSVWRQRGLCCQTGQERCACRNVRSYSGQGPVQAVCPAESARCACERQAERSACGCAEERTEDCDRGRSERSLAMVYAPKQSFCDLYDPRQGLCNGTVFEELNKPFLAYRRGL